MTVETELTLADSEAFRRFLRRAAKRINPRPWEPWFDWGFRISMLALIAAVASGIAMFVFHLLKISPEEWPSIWQQVGVLLILPLPYAAYFAFSTASTILTLRPYYRRLPEGDVLGDQELEMSADGISLRSKSYCRYYAWPTVVAAFELPRHFILMLDCTDGITIPKRCLSGDDEIVRRILVRQLGKLGRV